jgi:hypothetical protein
MRRRYGLFAPMLLNFDFTFLTLLLWTPEEGFTPCRGRCHANPLMKKPMCPNSPALELAADESVILAWWKLRDAVRDDEQAMPERALSWLLRASYHKAARRRPVFDAQVRQCMDELAALEEQNCPSLDRAADTFARLLQSAAPEGDERERVLGQLLYHLGRWIYLIDAQDDLAQDGQAGRYNPVAARFGAQGDEQAMQATLEHSLNLAAASFQLGDFGCRTAVLENILYLGLPLVQRAVFDGSWKEIKKEKIWSNHR